MEIMEYRFTQTETRADDKTLMGYASLFYDPTDQGTQYRLWENGVERISPTAFHRALQEQHDVRLLFNHDADHLLGRTISGTLSLSVDNKGLRYQATIDEDDKTWQLILPKIKRGDLDGSSFGFVVRGEEWSKENDVDVRTITDVDLFDCSIVTYPAYSSAGATVRSADHAKQSFLEHQTKMRLKKLAAPTSDA